MRSQRCSGRSPVNDTPTIKIFFFFFFFFFFGFFDRVDHCDEVLLAVAIQPPCSFVARDALIIIYVSALVAIGFGPVVRAIEHQTLVPVGTARLPRWLAILVVYWGDPRHPSRRSRPWWFRHSSRPGAAAQARGCRHTIDRAQNFLLERGIITHRITLEEAVQNAPGDSTTAEPPRLAPLPPPSVTMIKSLFGLVTVVILAFYLLIEADSLFAGFARLFPPSRRAEVRRASGEISTKVSAWMTGQLILGGTIGASSALGLYLLGVPYFYVLALISAVGELIPVVGPILAAIPAIITAFFVSPRTGTVGRPSSSLFSSRPRTISWCRR